jgi:hypothetical protein
MTRLYTERVFLYEVESLQIAITNGSVVASILLPLIAERHNKAAPDPALDQTISDAWKDFKEEKPVLEAAKVTRQAAEEAARERQVKATELKAEADKQLADAQAKKMAADSEIAKREHDQALVEREAAERRRAEMAPFERKREEAMARKADADAAKADIERKQMIYDSHGFIWRARHNLNEVEDQPK